MEEQQYGMGDLRQYIDGRPLFPTISPSPPPDLLSCHRGFNSPHPYDMLIFRSDSSTAIAPPSDGFEAEAGGLIVGGGGDSGAGRWPRQETLTLLEIRSRLDPKFKEANHKGPLWDEVSRIMSQEHGYQRSGKKCREKFENLYKYYKKTKEGKSGRQDGKHYRFFRQLEALYGDATTTAAHFHGGGNFQYNFPNSSSDNQELYPGSKISDASHVSVPDSCDYDTTTSSYCSDSNVVVGAVDAAGEDDARMKKRRGKKSLKTKIEASIDAQMRSMMEKQQAWMEKMAALVEAKERERLLREEQWRRQDAARIDGEQKMWAAERAWVGARDAALMAAFSKLTGKELEPHPPPPPPGEGSVVWPEREVARLIQLRSGMELRFQENGMASEESVWDEIAGKMAASACGGGGGGAGRSGSMCRDVISDYLIKCSKKRKENAKGFTYFHQNRDPISDHGVAGVDGAMRLHGGGNSPRNGGAGDAVNDGVFRYFVGDSFQRL